MTIALVIALALVVANGFFVAAEFGLARLRPTQVGQFEREGRIGAGSVRHAVEHLDAYLAACQLGITLTSIGLGVAGEPAFEHLLAPVLGPEAEVAGVALAAVVAFALMTLLHVVPGELAPKSVAISRTAETVLLLAPPLRVFYTVTKPLVDVFNGLANALLLPFGIPRASKAEPVPHTEAELRELLAESAEQGVIEDLEQQFAERGFRFSEARVSDVMQSRARIDYVTLERDVPDVAEIAVRAGHSRLPVCEPAGLDFPVGVVHVQDLLAALLSPEPPPLRELLRRIDRVGEDVPIAELLDQMRRSRGQMVLVQNGAGSTVGLATLEDLLEELVGEIADELEPAVTASTGGAAA